MLTSSMVQINISLPESDSKTVAPSDLIVMMTKDGNLTFNGKKTSKSALKNQIRTEISQMSNRENAAISIVAEIDVPWSRVQDVIKIASDLKVKAHIATQPRK